MIFKTLKKVVLLASVFLLLSPAVGAAPGNIAPEAKVTSSGSLSEAFDAANVTDGTIMWENTGERCFTRPAPMLRHRLYTIL